MPAAVALAARSALSSKYSASASGEAPPRLIRSHPCSLPPACGSRGTANALKRIESTQIKRKMSTASPARGWITCTSTCTCVATHHCCCCTHAIVLFCCCLLILIQYLLLLPPRRFRFLLLQSTLSSGSTTTSRTVDGRPRQVRSSGPHASPTRAARGGALTRRPQPERRRRRVRPAGRRGSADRRRRPVAPPNHPTTHLRLTPPSPTPPYPCTLLMRNHRPHVHPPSQAWRACCGGWRSGVRPARQPPRPWTRQLRPSQRRTAPPAVSSRRRVAAAAAAAAAAATTTARALGGSAPASTSSRSRRAP